MTKKQAQNLMNDLGKHLTESDFCQNIYISTQLCGSKVYRNCAYYDTDGYIFIWSKEKSEMLCHKEIGDYVTIPHTSEKILALKKVT